MGVKGVKYLATEENLTLDVEHTQYIYIYDILLNYILETYWLLLTNVTPIIFNKKHKK